MPCEPIPVGDDPDDDAYALIPIDLDVVDYDENENIAYQNNATGVKITYFPVIHTRKGSIGYKLEWNGLSMIYTGDTKPETNSLKQACNNVDGVNKGVDVFIHEMIVPAEIWAMKAARLTDPDDASEQAVEIATTVQNSSHSPQGAFGYLLSQIEPRPRLTVATHFPTADDTVACAMKSVGQHCRVVRGRDTLPGEGAARITWSFDLMVISVFPERIVEQQGKVQEFGFSATYQPPPGTIVDPGDFNTPKYHYPDQSGGTSGDPYAQIDTSTAICACDSDTECNYRIDGY